MFPESPAQDRYDKVDVLTLIDPHWLEHSQAAHLIQLMAEGDRDEQGNNIDRHDKVLAA